MRLKSGNNIQLLDVRAPGELALAHISGLVHTPLDGLLDHLEELEPDTEIVTLCKAGPRAAVATELLLESGFLNVKYLTGGLEAWAEQVDPDLLTY